MDSIITWMNSHNISFVDFIRIAIAIVIGFFSLVSARRLFGRIVDIEERLAGLYCDFGNFVNDLNKFLNTFADINRTFQIRALEKLETILLLIPKK